MGMVIRRPCLAAIISVASLGAAAETPLALHIHSDKAMSQVLVSPGMVGNDTFVLQLMAGDGTLGLAPLERKASLGADGYWHVADVPISRAGRWHIRIDAVTALRTITLEEDFEVPAQ
jgi:copper transport protein